MSLVDMSRRKLILAVLFFLSLSICLGKGLTAHTTLAATPTGQPYGTGYNGEGELGIGSTSQVTTPTLVQLPSGVTATSLSNGYYNSLALGSDGNVYGMGYNDYGQVGDGTTTLRSTPVKTDLPSGVTATAISAGYYDSLAIGSDTNVYAWGTSYYGEAGSVGSHYTPEILAMPSGVHGVAISANYYFSIILGDNGKVYGLGYNYYGELGDGTTTDSSSPVIAQLPNGVTATSIATGYYHTIAVGSDGKVYAWGDNTYGELGDNSTTASSTPVTAQLPNGVTATAVSAWGYNSMALGSDGKVYTWGYNSSGQIGNGTTTDAHTPYAVQLPAGVSVKSITQGEVSSLVIGSDGKVYAWGDNAYGEYGNGTTTSSSTPVAVTFGTGITPQFVTTSYYDTFYILAPVSLGINNVTHNEGNSGTTAFDFTVSLNGPSAYPVTVDYATADGTATQPGDYTATNGKLTFNTGEVTKTVTVLVNGDTDVEPNETFTVNLSGATNAAIETGTGTGTITNDDAPVGGSSLNLAVSPYPATPGQTVTVQVNVLPSDATGTVTLLIDGTPKGTLPVVNGTATFTFIAGDPGTYNLEVTYSGDVTHTGSSSTPFPFPVTTKPNTNQPPADLVAQLRQTPDRVATNTSDNPITYTFTVKNIGEGKAGSVSLALPIDPQLTLGYASFVDTRLWVTSVTTSSINIAIPDLFQNQVVTGTIVMHPLADPQPTLGSSVTSQASVRWTNSGGGNKQVLSNKVTFAFGAANSNLDVSGGQVQIMKVDTTTTAGKAVAVGDFWIPNEPVSAWLTKPDGTSAAVSQSSADDNGSYTITVNTTGLAAGTYVIAAHGERSDVYGSAVLTISASGTSQSQSAVRLTLKSLGNKTSVKAAP